MARTKGSGGRIRRGKPMRASLRRDGPPAEAQGGMSPRVNLSLETQLGALLFAIGKIYDLVGYAVIFKVDSVQRCPIAAEPVE